MDLMDILPILQGYLLPNRHEKLPEVHICMALAMHLATSSHQRINTPAHLLGDRGACAPVEPSKVIPHRR